MAGRDEPDVVRILREYRAALEANEAGLMAAMADRWLEIERRLEADIGLLSREMAELKAAGKAITEQMIWKAERYQMIKGQLEAEIQRYNEGYAVGTISRAQESYALLGIDAAQAAINVQYGPMGRYFTRINARAVEHLIGFAGDGSPLERLLRQAYPDATEGLLKALINGLARGQNPAQTAKDMANGLGMGLEHAVLIARTETARAYRTASAEQYRQSGVVVGFKRLVKVETACLGCLMLDGETLELASELTDHPLGKCTAVPCVEGVSAPRWETGETWFKSLTADEQRSRMGDAIYGGWKDGQFELADLSQVAHSAVWGDRPRVATLAELGINP